MMILEKPYVSEFLTQTLVQSQIPVLETDFTAAMQGINKVSPDFFLRALEQNPAAKIYTNSENALGFLWKNAEDHPAALAARLFKNKAETRRRLKPFYPEYFFQEYEFEELFRIHPDSLPYPLILKPSVGFFSLGVFPLFHAKDFLNALTCLRSQKDQVRTLYPESVMNHDFFLMEAMIQGEELAVDAYFDEQGEPVILNLMHHVFSSDTDVSDRLYLTSEDVFLNWREAAQTLLERVGSISGVKNFPVHLEFRVNPQRQAIPIEVNPLRFAGWCTTDLAWYAYGINPYQAYFENRRPDWEEIFKTRHDQIFTLTVADLPSSFHREDAESLNESELLRAYSCPLVFRPVDFHEHPLAGFVFAKTEKSHQEELSRISEMDFSRFFRMKGNP